MSRPLKSTAPASLITSSKPSRKTSQPQPCRQKRQPRSRPSMTSNEFRWRTLRILFADKREESQYTTHKQTQSANFAAYQVEAQTSVGVAGAEALGEMGAAGGTSVGLGESGSMNMAGLAAGHGHRWRNRSKPSRRNQQRDARRINADAQYHATAPASKHLLYRSRNNTARPSFPRRPPATQDNRRTKTSNPCLDAGHGSMGAGRDHPRAQVALLH